MTPVVTALVSDTYSEKHGLNKLVNVFCSGTRPTPGDKRIFAASRKKDFDELMGIGAFTPVHRSQVESHRLYGGRFVDEIKYEDTPEAQEKSRFVVQAYKDKKDGLLTRAPMV